MWTGGHTIGESLITDPPEGVEVVSNINIFPSKSSGFPRERLSVTRRLKFEVDKAAYSVGIPRVLPILTNADLIHTTSGLVPVMPKPWVTTISLPSSFYGLNEGWFRSERRRRILKHALASRFCKAILCYSAATMKGLEKSLGGELTDEVGRKISVLYPAVDHSRFVKKKRTDSTFRILFVGDHFFDKGGRELHKAASRLAAKYDIHLDLVTDAPARQREKLLSFVKNHQENWVSWHVPGVPRSKLVDEFYPNSDVFVMCSYMEVFGYVFLEAMASGLPVIGARVYAQKEIIREGENGYLIDVPVSSFEGCPELRTQEAVAEYRSVLFDESRFEPVVSQLEDRLTNLIENPSLCDRMSSKSLELVTEGPFSIGHRNRILGRIYLAALD